MTTLLERTLPRGEAASFFVPAGALLTLRQIGGGQSVGMLSFALDDPDERLSMFTSNAVNHSWKLTTGHLLLSTDARDLWTIEEDTVGEHYSGGGYCNVHVNERRHGTPGAATCEQNFAAAIAAHGLTPRRFDPDTCFNPFMRVDYGRDLSWTVAPSEARPDDRLALRSARDQIVAVSNCPQVLDATNGFELEEIALLVED